MKKRLFIIGLFMVVCALGFFGCGSNYIDDLSIEIDDISFELPDGQWEDITEEESEDNYSERNSVDYLAVYSSDSVRVGVSKMDANDTELTLFENGDSLYDFHDSDIITIVDGYRASVFIDDSKCSAYIEFSEGEYYYISINSYDDSSDINCKDKFVSILKSVKFSKPGDCTEPCISCDDMKDMYDPEDYNGEFAATSYGTVKDVEHSTDSDGSPIYIDLNAKYPDTSRTTGVIWEEYQDSFKSMDLDSLVGKKVMLTGTYYIYEGMLNVKLEGRSQITIFETLDEL